VLDVPDHAGYLALFGEEHLQRLRERAEESPPGRPA
jgi:hypothetical protein